MRSTVDTPRLSPESLQPNLSVEKTASNAVRRSARGRLTSACLGVAVTLLSLAGCSTLTEDVDPTVCLTGQRWVGGDLGSPEMHPGQDCVGCHRRDDGPPLMFGGTIYPTAMDLPNPAAMVDAPAPAGTGPVPFSVPQDDCFGLEGVTVTITGADGRVFTTVSNEAGNVFLEGDENELVKPYRVAISAVDPGTLMLAETEMMFDGNQGDCAGCHNGGGTATRFAGDVSFVRIHAFRGKTPDAWLAETGQAVAAPVAAGLPVAP